MDGGANQPVHPRVKTCLIQRRRPAAGCTRTMESFGNWRANWFATGLPAQTGQSKEVKRLAKSGVSGA